MIDDYIARLAAGLRGPALYTHRVLSENRGASRRVPRRTRLNGLDP